MSAPQILPDRLSLLERFNLAHGGHSGQVDPAQPELCSMEWVAFLAGEGITDAPACASPVLARYVIRLNDRWNDEQRQALKPYLVRMIGTGSDGKDPARERIAAEWVTKRLLPDWLRLAGMDDQIAALDAVEPGNWGQLRSTLYAVREAAWAKRSERREVIKQKVRDELAKREKPAVAAAAAAAAADADAVAVAVADAAADAAAAAVAVADADAVADAAAAAVAVADAAAAAAAVAVAAAAADAVAVAVAVAVAAADGGYWAAYQAAKPIFRKAYEESPAYAYVRDLANQQAPQALELLDLLIKAEEVSA